MDCARRWEWLSGWTAALALLALASSARADEWKFDILRLSGDRILRGLILDEDASEIHFQIIKQNPGQATKIFTTTRVAKTEIHGIVRLEDSERERLRERLKALDHTGASEKTRMQALVLKKMPWVVKSKDPALCFESPHFVLLSNANEEIVRRAAVRLEDIYEAYTRFLPPRRKRGNPSLIILVRSSTEYQALLKQQGRNVLNAAFFDPTRNQVCCGSELEELGSALEKLRRSNDDLLARLKKQEDELRKQFKKRVPPIVLKPILMKRGEIDQANKKNNAVFNENTQVLFQTLYHEAFHAYLANFVYPPNEADMPRWLNEGLAQIFETAIVEAGDLRVGHADGDRLRKIKDALAKKELIPLSDLLRSGPKQFLVVRAAKNQEISEKHYLNSWALAFYLTFDRRILGTPALDRYVEYLKKPGADERQAFRILVGKSLSEFERDYREYLSRLQADGTLRKKLRK